MDADFLKYISSAVVIVNPTGDIQHVSAGYKDVDSLVVGENILSSGKWNLTVLRTIMRGLADSKSGDEQLKIVYSPKLQQHARLHVVLLPGKQKELLIEIAPIENPDAPKGQAEKKLLDHSDNLLSLIDRNYQYQAVNEKYMQTWGRDRAQIEGCSVAEVLGEDVFTDVVKSKLDACFDGIPCEYNHWFYSPDRGNMMFLKVSYKPVRNKFSGKVDAVAVTVVDITDVAVDQRGLEDKAFTDALTGLSNRYGLERHFSDVCTSSARAKPHCLIFLDLDKFKQVNDSYGHAIGDQVLRYFSRQLEANMRKNDFCCRWGGDEFLVLLPDVKQNTPLQELERRFQALRELVYQVDQVFFKVDFSFGFSFFPYQSDSLQELIHIADVNLLEMKHKNP